MIPSGILKHDTFSLLVFQTWPSYDVDAPFLFPTPTESTITTETLLSGEQYQSLLSN